MISKLPIVIIASSRSGSSALAQHISSLYNIKNWSEPTRDVEEFEKFKQYITRGNINYVLKIISYQISSTEIYQTILANDCYKIKLTRENKLDQIVSHYIGHCTQVWNSTDQYARGVQYTVPADIKLINDAIQTVIFNDKVFDGLGIEFDETLTYEELISHTNLDSTGLAKIIPPTNYNEIKLVIEKEYDKYR